MMMTESLLTTLISNGVTLLVASGGWVFAYSMQRDARRSARQVARIDRLETELLARIALEKETCHWVASALERTPDAIKKELRQLSHERTGLRPSMSASDISK